MPLATYGDYEIEATALDIASNAVDIMPENEHSTYSVYVRLPPDPEDGHRYASWLADFAIKADAIMFAIMKGTPA